MCVAEATCPKGFWTHQVFVIVKAEDQQSHGIAEDIPGPVCDLLSANTPGEKGQGGIPQLWWHKVNEASNPSVETCHRFIVSH